MKINTHEHIGVDLVDSELKVVSKYDQNFRNIYDHLARKTYQNSEYPFLSTIDPYSYTLYNALQVPLLVEELQKLASEDEDTELKAAVEKLVEYLETVSVHCFIRFIGD